MSNTQIKILIVYDWKFNIFQKPKNSYFNHNQKSNEWNKNTLYGWNEQFYFIRRTSFVQLKIIPFFKIYETIVFRDYYQRTVLPPSQRISLIVNPCFIDVYTRFTIPKIFVAKITTPTILMAKLSKMNQIIHMCRWFPASRIHLGVVSRFYY